MRSIRNAVGLLSAVLVTVFAASGGVSHAGDFLLNPCDDRSSVQAWVAAPENSPGWRIYPSCPGVLEIDSVDSASGTARWTYSTARPGVAISSITVIVSGSNGDDGAKQLGLRVCGSSGCGSPITTQEPYIPPEFATEQSFVVGSPEVPLDATSVELFATCLQAVCSDSRRFTVEHMRLGIADATPPTPPDFLSSSTLKAGQWNGGLRTVAARATDVGSGIASLATIGNDRFKLPPTGIKIEGRQPCYIWDVWANRFCETTASASINWDFRLGLLSQGEASMRLVAIDQAGNRSTPEITVEFKVDTIVPPSPNDAHLTNANDDGWINEPTFDLAWTNRGETAETATESGIGGAAVRADPPDAPVFSLFNPPMQPTEVTTVVDKALPSDGEWRVTMATVDRAGNRSPSISLPVKRDTTELAAPSLNGPAIIGIAQQDAGRAITWQPPSNVGVSGVCGYSTTVSDDPGTVLDPTIDIEGNVDHAALPSGVDDGSHFIHLRAVSCASKPGLAASMPVVVDFSRPRVEISPRVGWSDGATPYRLSGFDDGTGVARMRFSIDGKTEQMVTGANADLELGDGWHTIEFTAEDAAGNLSAAATAGVGIDRAPPQAVLETVDENDPTLVRARVSDTISGVAWARIEYRPVAGDTWEALTATSPDQRGSESLTLNGRLPDDRLKPGRYLLRVAGRDVAGNAFSNSVRSNGAAGVVDLPLRAKATISAGFSVARKTSCKNRKGRVRRCIRNKLVRLRTVDFGRTARVVGRLTGAGGRPLAGYSLEVVSQTWFTTAVVPIATLKTDKRGTFKYTVPAGASRKVTMRFRGTKRMLPAVATVDLDVRARVTLSLSRRNVRRNDRVVIRGRLNTGGGTVPVFGKRIDLQYRQNRRWKPFPVELPNVQANGRFRLVWTVPPFAGPVRMTLRAKVGMEEPWPYAAGVSRPVTLTFRP